MRRRWLIGLLAVLTGCGTVPAGPQPSTSPVAAQGVAKADQSIYYPMGEDLRWIYEDGPLNSPLPMKRRSTWFLDIRRGDEGSAMIGVQMRNQDKAGQVIHNNLGAFFAPQSGNQVGPRHILIKYPLLIGSGWDIVNTPEVVVRGQVEGIEMVRVPAGTYARCFRVSLYRKTAGQPEVRYASRWLAPSVGLVQQYNYGKDGKVTSVSRLRQFATGMAPSPDESQATSRLFGSYHFNEMDVNDDGFLGPFEVGPADLFTRADLNNDDKLDRYEFFQSELYAVYIKRQLQAASREFWAFDLDFDMELSVREASRQTWINLPRALRLADLAAVDHDGNDRLSYREFHELYRRLWGEALENGGKAPSFKG